MKEKEGDEKESFSKPKLSKEQKKALKAWQEKGKIPNPFDSDSKPIRARSMANAFQDSGLKLGRLFNCTFRVYLEKKAVKIAIPIGYGGLKSR